jgi:hypothetical protein
LAYYFPNVDAAIAVSVNQDSADVAEVLRAAARVLFP